MKPNPLNQMLPHYFWPPAFRRRTGVIEKKDLRFLPGTVKDAQGQKIFSSPHKITILIITVHCAVKLWLTNNSTNNDPWLSRQMGQCAIWPVFYLLMFCFWEFWIWIPCLSVILCSGSGCFIFLCVCLFYCKKSKIK